MQWVKDQMIEQNLKKMGIKFEIQNVKMEDIDFELSLRKQIRLAEKVNEDWVLEYAVGMERGDPFHMPILNKLKKGYFFFNGLHRGHAARLNGETSIMAYVIEVTDPRLSDMLPRISAAWEGHGLSREEKLIQASYLVQHHSVQTDEAASFMGLQPEWLRTYQRAGEVASKIKDQGIDADGFSKSLLIRLNTLADNANVLRETAKLLKRHKLAANQNTYQIIMDVKSKETEASKIAELERWDKLMTTKNKPDKVNVPYRQPVRTQAIGLLTRLNKLLDSYPSMTQLQIVDDSDVKLIKTYWTKIENNMNSILGKGVS